MGWGVGGVEVVQGGWVEGGWGVGVHSSAAAETNGAGAGRKGVLSAGKELRPRQARPPPPSLPLTRAHAPKWPSK